MFRLWGKIFNKNRLIKDITICDADTKKSYDRKVAEAVDEICYEFDLSKPIWLESNTREFKQRGKTRFYQDNFIDSINFDFLEIHVIEEDGKF